MSHDSGHGKHHGATTVRASKGGGGGKALLGLAALAVVLGGGYYAWTQYGQNQTQAPSSFETAYNDTYADDDPVRAGPVEDAQDPFADESATAQSGAEPAAATSAPRVRTRAAAPARVQTAEGSAAVPEETIGITPINATTTAAADVPDQGDDIVVTAGQRPVWVRTPNLRRLSAFYPESALVRGQEGEARLNCNVVDGGALDCVRATETSNSFGTAAMRVARSYRHAAYRADGSSAVGTPVNLRVVFRLEDEERRGRG